MALDHLIRIAAEHFGIQKPEDWCDVRPEWILTVHGCGPETLAHIRLYLSARGLTLRNDKTPNYWQEHLSTAKIGGQLSPVDRAIIAPFTVLIDVQEKQPFTFQGLKADSDQGGRPLIVPFEYKALGPTHGDYSLAGFEGEIHVERKSMADAHATFLSHGERRERWEATLAFLAEILCGAIVIECSLGQLIQNVESRGSRSVGTLAKTIHRQVIAWQEDYRIPFYFCDDRRLAEKTCFFILRRSHRTILEFRKNEPSHSMDEVVAQL